MDDTGGPLDIVCVAFSTRVHIQGCACCVFNSFFAQLSWMTEFLPRGVRGAPVPLLWHQAAIVLLSQSIMSSKAWPCSRGRGPITRLITQAWLLLSGDVPGHLSLLLSGQKEDDAKSGMGRTCGICKILGGSHQCGQVVMTTKPRI